MNRKEVVKMEDPEFGTSDVSTGSSRSTVSSEKTDVGVMFRRDVNITGISVGYCAETNCGCTDHQHCMPVVSAGGGCGKAIGKFGVGRLKMLCRSKLCRSMIGPKYGQDG